MSIFSSIDIGSTGLTAQRLRMDTISRNIANADVTKTASGTPYRRQVTVMREIKETNFDDYFNNALKKNIYGKGVEVVAVVDDTSDFKMKYDPSHPDANKDGYLLMPNVDIVTEMVNMIAASRAYEANITSINNAKSMAMKALEIGSR